MVIEGQGLRFDYNKVQLHLIPIDPLMEIARVFTQGAQKYAPRNWEKGMEWSRVYNSLMRHSLAFWNGENLDKESNLHHMAHVAVNAMFLIEYNKTHRNLDDRPGSNKENDNNLSINSNK